MSDEDSAGNDEDQDGWNVSKFHLVSAVLVFPIKAARIPADQHAHHSSEVERSGDAGGHTHHPSQGQHRTDVPETNRGEADERVVVDCRKQAGAGQDARVAGIGQFQGHETARLDGFQGTHH